MAVPKIGAYYLYDMRGTVVPTATQLEAIGRPGVDGLAYRDTGERAHESTLYTETMLAALLDVENRLAQYKALVGTTVTIIDAFGSSFSSVMVIDVQFIGQQAFSGVCSTAGSRSPTATPLASMSCLWVVQKT